MGRLDLEHDCAGLVVTWVWMGCFGQGFGWVGWIKGMVGFVGVEFGWVGWSWGGMGPIWRLICAA